MDFAGTSRGNNYSIIPYTVIGGERPTDYGVRIDDGYRQVIEGLSIGVLPVGYSHTRSNTWVWEADTRLWDNLDYEGMGVP